MTIESRYMGVRECGLYLGFSDDKRGRDRVYQWVARGHLPYMKFGRTIRFDKVAVDKTMARRGIPTYNDAERNWRP